MDPHQANLQFHLLSTATFLGITFDRTLSFFCTCIFAEGQALPSSQGLTLCFCFLMESLQRSGILANCSFCGTEATISFSAGPICSSFSAETCAILQIFCWSRQHQQVCHFSFFSCSLTLCPLLRLSFYLNLSGRSCLLFPSILSGYNGSWTLVSPGERSG